MPQAVLEIVGPSQKLESLPLQVTQKVSTTSAIVRLALIIPAILLVLIPVTSLPDSAFALAQAAEHPGDALLAGIGIAIFVALFGFPLSRAIAALGSQRTVRIAQGFVTVENRSFFGTRTWTLPLQSYQGVAHIVRTSLSGARHELVLVHASRARRVLLCASDRLTESDLANAGHLLDLPLVPANDLYRWPKRQETAAARPVELVQAA